MINESLIRKKDLKLPFDNNSTIKVFQSSVPEKFKSRNLLKITVQIKSISVSLQIFNIVIQRLKNIGENILVFCTFR